MTDEFHVAVYILECQDRNEPVWYGKLAEAFGTGVSYMIDHLFDACILNGDWEKVNGSWKRTFTIDEDFELFIRGMKDDRQLS